MIHTDHTPSGTPQTILIYIITIQHLLRSGQRIPCRRTRRLPFVKFNSAQTTPVSEDLVTLHNTKGGTPLPTTRKADTAQHAIRSATYTPTEISVNKHAFYTRNIYIAS